MPVSFLTATQRSNYGRYAGIPTPEELARYFHLDDADRALIATKRGEHNRLGFALQLATVRFLGTFLDDLTTLPEVVIHTVSKQLDINDRNALSAYDDNRQRWAHTTEIRTRFGYREFVDPSVGFRLTRWLYALCWTGTERPSVLFDRATAWLLANKILLPGASVLECFVARLRSRVEERLWRVLGRITPEQNARLNELLIVPPGGRSSWLDRLRTGPIRVSAPAFVAATKRLQSVRDLGISLPSAAHIPPSRIATLARFANTSKVTAVARLPRARRIATLVAFVHTLEATAQDDSLEVLEILLNDLFDEAKKADRKARLRTLKDLDAAATTLAHACTVLLDESKPDPEVRESIFAQIPKPVLAQALADVRSLVRPPQDVFYRELQARYRRVRRFLPALLTHIRFGASPAGKAVVQALDYLRMVEKAPKEEPAAPLTVVSKAWQRHVVKDNGQVDRRAYTFCTLDELRTALHRREIYVSPSWRYADPRIGLLTGQEWESIRPMMCRTLGLTPDPQPVLKALAEELDGAYHAVAARLPQNPAVRIEKVSGKDDLILTALDRIEDPSSLVALRTEVSARLPRVDLPEILLEIAARTGCTDAFTHVSERAARVTDLRTSLCAVLLAGACNTGLEPLARQDMPSLRRDRLTWVNQNYIRDETLLAANARLVAAQNQIALAHTWGGGEVASADGLRFVVPVRTVHAGPNPKYFGIGRGVTWYNLMSNQFTGLHGITVAGTLRDSLVLLAVVLEQQTELQPTQIMTDTGAYSDIVFGLFRPLGYRFSPRLADIGGTRFWRIDANADYGQLNGIARQRVNLNLPARHWDDMLRLAGSLKLGRVRATGIMRTLQVGDRPTRLAQAIGEFGRIEKTLHTLGFIDDETKRRGTLIQLNHGEARHSLARVVFHARRGELRQRYREGQEDQLGTLGLVVNIIVLWNTIYMEAALDRLRREGYPVRDHDVAHLSPLIYDHINVLGRYSFAVPESVARGELRPLRNPADDDA